MSSTHHPESAETKSAWPMFIGALVMIGAFLVIALLLRGVAPSGATDDTEKAETRRTNLASLEETDHEELNTYGWVDREKGSVRLPIAEAMTAEIALLNQQEPRPAYPVATPAPAVAADAAPADAPEGGAEAEANQPAEATAAKPPAGESSETTSAPEEPATTPETAGGQSTPTSEAKPSATPGAPGAEPAETATPAPTVDQP